MVSGVRSRLRVSPDGIHKHPDLEARREQHERAVEEILRVDNVGPQIGKPSGAKLGRSQRPHNLVRQVHGAVVLPPTVGSGPRRDRTMHSPSSGDWRFGSGLKRGASKVISCQYFLSVDLDPLGLGALGPLLASQGLHVLDLIDFIDDLHP